MTAAPENAPPLSRTPPDEALARLTRLAARVLRAPAALLHLKADGRQFFTSFAGLPEPNAHCQPASPTGGLCPFIIAAEDMLAVPDLRREPRFRDITTSTEWGITSFAGFPLRLEGEVVGILAVYGPEPRDWTHDEREILRDLAESVVAELGRQRELAQRELVEAALRISEERYRTLVELSSDGIFLESERGEILDCNEAACRIYGYTREELIGLSIADLVTEEFAAKLPEIITEDTGGVPLERESRRRDGSIFPSEIATRLYEVAGERRLFAYVRDATRRKRTESILTTKTTILDAISRGRPLTEVLEQLVEAMEQQIPGMLMSILLLREERLWCAAAPSLPEAYNRIIDGVRIGPAAGSCGTAAYLGEQVVVSDIATDPRWEGYREHPLTYGLRACWSQPILGSQGEVLGTFAAYYEDVRTPSPDEIEIVEGAASLAGIAIERTRAAAALQESELRFRTLVEGIEEVFVIIDADGNIRYTSPASQRVTGFTSNERIGKLALDIIHPDDLALVHAKYLELVATPGAVIQLEAHIQHKDGSRRRISLLGKNLLHDPHLRGLVITYQDITEQRQLEEQLREAQRLEAVGRLAGGVAHDFNNLLNVIGGIVHLILLTRPEEGALQEDLQEILAAVRQATSLTQQLLAFSRRQMLQPQVLDIDRELDETSRMLRRVIGTDIALTTSLHSQGHTRADPGQINQVLMNLAVNARDAMPQGGTLTIETRATEITAAEVRCLPYPLPAGPYIEISMRDTGHGMDEKTLAHIFEPFFTTKGPGKGTGLGLPTVYGIVKQSDGFLRAESTPGQGSTFQIYLPHVPAQAKPDPTTRTTPPAAQGETILVVEDEPAMRMVTRRILEGSGYHVIEAPGGEEALQIVNEHADRIDLVLTDIIMPGLSGAALAEHLLRQHPTLRILYMSGYTDDQVIRHGLRQEKTHFLQKPFEAEQLTRRVREVLGSLVLRPREDHTGSNR